MPEDRAIEIGTTREGETSVVTPQGDIDMSTSPGLRAALRGESERGAKRLVVDLGAVGYMDSSGLATLVEAMKLAKGSGATLVLCRMNPQVRAIFEIARLDTFFKIVDAVDSAKSA
ncbi:MAG: STAS domain-containing protein [Phycisphaerales bacterium]|jgi:anti-sigma B factor antagonist|nr:STAS domain-containing protein [Phycisphaerales bacterium]